jgi:hypothetical protein
MARQSVRRSTARREATGLLADIGDFINNLTAGLFDAYRPEQHYMRGPGPKWHAKHDPSPAAGFQAVPALVRVRVK